MVNSQLIDLLRHFSPKELHELQLFVASPYFNRGVFCDETLLLMQLIARSAPDFSEADLDRNVAYRTLFPGAPMVDGKLDKVMSELHKMVKEFIAVSRYTQQEYTFRRLLEQAAFYRDQGLDNRYHNTIQRLEAYQNNSTRLGQDFFERAFLLDHEIHAYENLHNQKRGDVHIQKTLQSLDLHYFFLKTQLLNMYLLQQKVTQLEIPAEMIQAIRESHLPERYAETYPVLLISYKIFRLLEKEHTSVSEFEHLHTLLRQHESEIDPDLLKYYHTFIRNFCVLLVNSGRSEFHPMLFTFQKEHLERGYMYYDNKISPSAFFSVSNTALRLKDFEWAERFILSHRHRIISDNEHQDYFKLMYANYLFYIGEYNRALDSLPQTFLETDYHLLLKRLELKIYYELRSDLLSYKIDAFKMYLSRASQKLLSALKKEGNVHFVNLLFQLSNTAKGDTTRAQRLIQRIEAKTSIADRDWLLEKAGQLA